MSAMLKREQKLRQAPSCQRAISLHLSSRHEINRQLRLRVVREFNLPDAVADLLEVREVLPPVLTSHPEAILLTVHRKHL
jgi:BTB/POZ domain-containing protein 7